MIRRIAAIGTLSAGCVLSLTPAFAATPTPTPGLSVYELPTERLAVASNASLPGAVADDRGINLGGLGSDLYRQPGVPGVYWAVTDRGPNNDTVQANGQAGTGFPVADFSPLIRQFSVNGPTLRVLKTMTIQSSPGVGVTGLPNVPGYDGPPTTVTGGPVRYDVNGLDTEGIVRTKSGDFWLVEEYGPSVVQVGADGVVKRRLVPAGWPGTGTAYPTTANLPGVYLTRKVNRGFEAAALTPSEKYLYVGLQSPLLNPTKAVGDASRQTRILRVNLATGAVDGEWVHVFDAVNTIDPSTTKASELKLSAMVALDDDTVLVQERTDNAFIVVQEDLTAAQSILGGRFDDAATKPSLEALGAGDPSLLAVMSVKTLVFRSSWVPELPKKVEGMAVENPNTLAFMNDNDFSFTADAKSGKVAAGPIPTQFMYVTLPQSLPTTPDQTFAALKATAAAKTTAR